MQRDDYAETLGGLYIYIYILASVYLTSKVLGCCKGTLFVSQSQAADFVPPSSSLIFMG